MTRAGMLALALALSIGVLGSGKISASQGAFIPLVSTQWHLAGEQALDLQALRQWGAHPKIEQEYGVRSLTLKTYERADQSAQAVFEQTSDPTSAYGLLTFYRAAQAKRVKGVRLAVETRSGALMARGKFFIRILASSGISDDDLRSLLIALGGANPSSDVKVLLPANLPTQHLDKGSFKYLLGPEAARSALPQLPAELIGFSRGAEVETGVYRFGQQSFTVALISYPTPQIAQQQFATLDRALDADSGRPSGVSLGKQDGTYVALALGAPSRSLATRALGFFKVSDQVSWDQPKPLSSREEALEWVHLFFSNALIVVVSAGFGLIWGVLIYLGRLGLGRLFPNAEWANTGRDSMIRLNLE